MASQVAMTETYQDVERLIYQEVARFSKKFGVDFDDLLGEANIAFMRAYNAYDPDRGEFTTLLVTAIRNRLFQYIRKEQRVSSREKQWTKRDASDKPLTMEQAIEGPRLKPFDLESFLSEVGDDAKAVVEMLFNTPEDLHYLFFWRGGQDRHWLPTLRRYLKGLGWNADRVRQAFSEVEMAVSAA